MNFREETRAEWLERVGGWEHVVRPDLINIISHYESEGIEEFAMFGMCFGGKVSTLAAIHFGDKFVATGLLHPSLVSNEEAVHVTMPMYLMPAAGDLDICHVLIFKENRKIFFFLSVTILRSA